jgi:hypothetical protein
MSSVPSASGSSRRSSPPPVNWRSWPLVEGGAKSLALLLAGLAVSAATGYVSASAFWTALATLAIAASLWRFFVPVYFEFSAMGVTQQVLGRRRRIAWQFIERCEICRAGIFLLPHDAPLAVFRGLYIPWGSHRAEVLALVQFYLPRARQESDSKLDFELRL